MSINLTTTRTASLHNLLMGLCAHQSNTRPWLREPWREGDWVYYSDGRVIARTPYAEKYHKAIKVPPKKERHRGLALFMDRFGEGEEFLTLPTFGKPKTCPVCDGERHRGPYGECRICDATGLRGDPIELFDLTWSAAYLWLLQRLPVLKARPPVTPDGYTQMPMELLFDGGQALLMPRSDFTRVNHR